MNENLLLLHLARCEAIIRQLEQRNLELETELARRETEAQAASGEQRDAAADSRPDNI